MAERGDITPPQAQVVCFGMITAGVVLAVDRPPEHNTGQLVRHRAEFISDDAALVACALRQWNVRTALIWYGRGRRPSRQKDSRPAESSGRDWRRTSIG